MYVFISHSSQNSGTAEDICKLIESNGHQCFLAPRDIRSGHEYAEEIINGIDRSGVMVLVLSKDSNESPHVLREIERAVSKRVPIIVYKLEDVQLSKSMEYFLMSHQWVSKKPNIDYGAVVKCINDLENGTLRITLSAPPSAEPKPAPAPTPAITPAASPIPTPAPAPVYATTAQKPKKKFPTKALIITAISLAVIFVIGLGFSALVNMVESMADAVNNAGGFDAQVGDGDNNISISFGRDETEESGKPPVALEGDLEDALLGESIMFGHYNGQPIEWRFIHISDDNTKAVVIADDILTMKCYDAAEGGKYNFYDGEYYWNTPSAELDAELDRLVRGDNSWERSNIRAWLNSEKENVTYIGQEPNAQAMSEEKNGYNTEAGFLNGFTIEELNAIVPTEITTNGVVTEDRVYLLSYEEMKWLNAADVSKYAIPTQQARELDTSRWYELHMSDYGVNDHYWWLRDGDGTTASGVNVVSFSYAGGNIISQPAGLEGYGVRPVMTLDISSDSTVVLNYIAQEFLNEITQP